MGEWDFYINLIMRFPAWTPEMIDAMDPDFVEELAARLEAETIQAGKPRSKK